MNHAATTPQTKAAPREAERPRSAVRLFGERVSLRLNVRPLVVCVFLAVAAAALGLVALALGDYPIPLAELPSLLTGGGHGGDRFIVVGLRLPRLLCGLLIGAGLGASGAIFQSLTRNPLASPDIIGFTTGAATGGILVIVLLAGDSGQVAIGALIAGAVVSLLVYVMSFKRGVQGYRLILMGIAMTSVLVSVNSYLLTRAELEIAANAQRWLIGSLNGVAWTDVGVLMVVPVVLLPLAMLMGGRLRLLELGDEHARGLGLSVERTRLGLVLVSVSMTAVATAAAGPIAFVALAAPQLARRLTRTGGEGLASSALMGALLLVGADIAAQWVLPGVQLPVGILTGVIGGLYLVLLLTSQWRAGRG
ncbi:iron chelate uptake ABC transporter family permease subunit [Nonomuraea sp. NPDC050404]|uniref:FecCD family ABC transporter permease n=1 Tax=Nonomuraea sp. NPDC050404 TaxID=3155783 RepID=UPI0033F64C6D